MLTRSNSADAFGATPGNKLDANGPPACPEFELDEIWYYVARESGSAEIANRLIDSLTDHFFLLANHPYAGRRRDDLRPGLRSFPVGQYIIIYRIDDADVVILHMMHSHCDIQTIFGH